MYRRLGLCIFVTFNIAVTSMAADRPWLFDNRLMIAVDGATPVAPAAHAPLSVTFANGGHIELKPMFDTTVPETLSAAPKGTFGFGVEGERMVNRRWFTFELTDDSGRAFGVDGWPSDENPWDTAHAMVDAYTLADRNAFGAFAQTTGGVPSIIEPDIIYRRPDDARREAAAASAVSATVPVAAGAAMALSPTTTVDGTPSIHWPHGSTFAWHLEPAYTDLKSARESAAPYFADPDRRVRVAHIDTGWDARPDSITPLNFFAADARNFMPKGTPDDSHDRAGHGTGTLSVLAGGTVHLAGDGYDFNDFLGGAPLARVTSYRISDSVIHIWPSAMSKAIAWSADHDIDVISMSAGGAPSLALRDAVNKAYDHGVAMFFAAGDFFRLPIPFCECFETPPWTVYPARFTPAVSVVGATASRRSYGHDPGFLSLFTFHNIGSWMLRGSYGPEKVAGHSIAAFSPNIARHAAGGASDHVAVSFGGTSAATPQVAAAATLWLQKNRGDIEARGWWPDWRKAQAVYDALTASADRNFQQYRRSEFGAGLLRANNALAAPIEEKPAKAKAATIGFDWVSIIAAIVAPSNFDPETQKKILDIHRQMIASEVAQLVSTSKNLQNVLANDENRDADSPSYTLTPQRKDEFIAALRSDPRASRTLASAFDPTAKRLAKDESASFVVSARKYWNHSNVWVQPGEAYRIDVAPNARWTDFFIRSGPAGYHRPWLDSCRKRLRNINAPFFALMVTTEADDRGAYAVATTDRPYLDRLQPIRRGELTFFANDVPGFYWNNWSSVDVKITRIE